MVSPRIICILHFFLFFSLPAAATTPKITPTQKPTPTKKDKNSETRRLKSIETDNGIHGFHNLWLSNIPGVVTNQWNDNCDYVKLL